MKEETASKLFWFGLFVMIFTIVLFVTGILIGNLGLLLFFIAIVIMIIGFVLSS